MKKRWISLYVENEVGVLAKVAGLFSGKSYNLDSLTVGTTEDVTVSRMTIGAICDDATFEQIKKQLNKFVEVIKVIDITDKDYYMNEILFIKLNNLNEEEKTEAFRIASAYKSKVVDYGFNSMLIESVQSDKRNNDLIKLMKTTFKNIEIVRGGSVAIESINKSSMH